MIQLKKVKTISSSTTLKPSATFADNIVTKQKSYGRVMNVATFQEFQNVVNRHRPYCSFDFKNQHFIDDVSSI